MDPISLTLTHVHICTRMYTPAQVACLHAHTCAYSRSGSYPTRFLWPQFLPLGEPQPHPETLHLNPESMFSRENVPKLWPFNYTALQTSGGQDSPSPPVPCRSTWWTDRKMLKHYFDPHAVGSIEAMPGSAQVRDRLKQVVMGWLGNFITLCPAEYEFWFPSIYAPYRESMGALWTVWTKGDGSHRAVIRV